MPSFSPGAHERIVIEVHGIPRSFVVVEHPAAPGVVHSMQGGEGEVFHLRDEATGQGCALKVFNPARRHPDLQTVARALADFKKLPGLSVCDRFCLTPDNAPRTLAQHPDLAMAILMPWLRGITWGDQMLAAIPLMFEVALPLAEGLAASVEALEAARAAHCDVSAGNVIFDRHTGAVHLVDVENLYVPWRPPLPFVLLGTPGYQHVSSRLGQWGPHADRFALSVILAEILGWTDPRVVSARAHGSYFDPADLQVPSYRYDVVSRALHYLAPAFAQLFERAWRSRTFAECPAPSEWRAAIGTLLPIPPAQVQANAVAPIPAVRTIPTTQVAPPPPRIDPAVFEPAPTASPTQRALAPLASAVVWEAWSLASAPPPANHAPPASSVVFDPVELPAPASPAESSVVWEPLGESTLEPRGNPKRGG